jgi:chemotaxis protein MotA
VDKSTFAGIFLALAGIVAGLILEGGKIGQIVQPRAAMIVFGGTLGAVTVQFPSEIVIQAFKRFANVFFARTPNPQGLVKELVGYANEARKNGIVSLDAKLNKIKTHFLRNL